jgi:hypothetical protein
MNRLSKRKSLSPKKTKKLSRTRKYKSLSPKKSYKKSQQKSVLLPLELEKEVLDFIPEEEFSDMVRSGEILSFKHKNLLKYIKHRAVRRIIDLLNKFNKLDITDLNKKKDKTQIKLIIDVNVFDVDKILNFFDELSQDFHFVDLEDIGGFSKQYYYNFYDLIQLSISTEALNGGVRFKINIETDDEYLFLITYREIKNFFK